jgi:hypothetical protein
VPVLPDWAVAYDVVPDDDPEQEKVALRKSFGALAGVNVQILLRDIRNERSQGNRSRPANS